MRLFFYSLTLHPAPSSLIGASVYMGPAVYYFSTQRKLDNWKNKHKDDPGQATWAMHEIDAQCAKELVKLSKKKTKPKCQECGR